MEELLSQQKTPVTLARGQAVSGVIVAVTGGEVILDLGTKAEGVLLKKDLPTSMLEAIKVGETVECFVVYPENDSGQVVLSPVRLGSKVTNMAKWNKLKESQDTKQLLTGTGVEVNKGGLVVEVSGMRGFMPISQANLSQAGNLEQLIGQQFKVRILESDPNQNRLILTQVVETNAADTELLNSLKPGEPVEGVIESILPFGLLVRLENGLIGLVHISELSWERTEDPTKDFTVGQSLKTQVVSVDEEQAKVNLSVKQLTADPLANLSEKYQSDDVVKGTVTNVASTGTVVTLEDGVEGFIPAESIEAGKVYAVGDTLTLLVDRVDVSKRRVVLAPFLTSTSGLIYK
jgi:ribosomal protein S1